MADFERKLTMLAERGTLVGPEEMIERVAAVMAKDPLVVVSKQRKGWGMSVETEEERDQNKGKWRRGLIWAVTMFVAIVGFGVLYETLTDDGGPEVLRPAPTTTLVSSQMSSDIAVIERYLTVWYHRNFWGELGTILRTETVEARGQQGWGEWSSYELAVEADVEVACTPRERGRAYDCEILYSNILYEAVDADPAVLGWSGRLIDDETIEFFEIPLPSYDTPVMRSWFSWEMAVGAESLCDQNSLPTHACATYQIEHIDDWAAWYLENN